MWSIIRTLYGDILNKYMRQAIADGRETVLSKEQMNHDADLHHARALCAIDEYNRILADIKANPERREYYKDYIKAIFKKYNKPLLEDLDKPYFLRGAGKKLCISQAFCFIFRDKCFEFIRFIISNLYQSYVIRRLFIFKCCFWRLITTYK
ncbi:hypothetical protein [Ruminococcus sp. NK3A76]|uniref:hypothetical protein n=1 Tax=Ruminococcus sp. NK3A76 TaxID=877411 RepID=UPI00048C7F3A|nr:hypothetical protein [Ruminococcus sp. NK3A76]